MKLCRRRFLQLAAGAATLPAVSRLAKAHPYPTRPVRWIVPMSAGAPPDIVARTMAQWLSERLGQPFVVENRPGAGGTIGTEAVVRAPAGRPYAPRNGSKQRDQRYAFRYTLREAQFQCCPRHRAGRDLHPPGPSHGGESIVSG
jgi:tripartite-type tricarboxylate transporter receptor subunit TctC